MHSINQAKNLYGKSAASNRPLPTEIVPMNQAGSGQPIFWIHAAAGGSSVGQYQRFADVSQRPFYAIKPPTIDIAHYWLWGLEARACYYTALITSIDPIGPYDLGGYSMGCTLAYEVARQLLALGRKVQSLVLIDPTDMACVQQWAQAHDSSLVGLQSLLLRTLNFSLLSDSWDTGQDSPVVFIHRDDVMGYNSIDTFMERLMELGHQRGLKLSREQFMFRVIQDRQLLNSLVCEGYNQPLPAPNDLNGFLFINRSGAMQGACAPYILMDDSLAGAVEKHYNAEWLTQCSAFKHYELETTSHFMLLFESHALLPCVRLCETLYRVS